MKWAARGLGLAVCLMAAVDAAQAKLNVVCTTPDLAALARAVGGEAAEVSSLARPTEDPHFVEPKPSLIVRLRDADALVEGGAELEIGWLPPLLERAGNRQIMPGSKGHVKGNEGVKMLEVPGTLDRSKGDIHAAGNPHYLMDPLNAKVVAEHLERAFASLEPGSAAVFKANREKLSAQLEERMGVWQSKLAPFKGETVVGYHNSWPYFGERFGVRIDLFLEPKPGIPPSPAHLAQVIMEMKRRKSRVVIVDAYLDRRTAETVAARTDATVVEVTQFPGGVKGTEGGYLELMDHLVQSLATALSHK